MKRVAIKSVAIFLVVILILIAFCLTVVPFVFGALFRLTAGAFRGGQDTTTEALEYLFGAYRALMAKDVGHGGQ